MNGPQKFRKKPVVIEAMRLHAGVDREDFLDPNTRALTEIAGWMHSHNFRAFRVADDKPPHGMEIDTLEGVMRADPGDWIVRGVAGEFYPCKPDIFDATYEPVDGAA